MTTTSLPPIPLNSVLTNIGGTLTGASISTVLDHGVGSKPGQLLYRGPNGWAEIAISNNLAITGDTLDTAAMLLTPGANRYIFSNDAGLFEGVAATGWLDVIFNKGTPVAAGTYVIATALTCAVQWTAAKTWVSGSSPRAILNVQTVHAGVIESVGGLNAIVANAGVPSRPVSYAALAPNRSVAGDTVQVTISNLSGYHYRAWGPTRIRPNRLRKNLRRRIRDERNRPKAKFEGCPLSRFESGSEHSVRRYHTLPLRQGGLAVDDGCAGRTGRGGSLFGQPWAASATLRAG